MRHLQPKDDNMKVKGKSTLDLYFSMSTREAEALMTIMAHVAGAPEGPRGISQDITKALRNMGIRPRGAGSNGIIHLPDTWERFGALQQD
jgi:hypothetical protein